MTEPHRVGDLEIEEDLKFQEKEWKIQRAGWVVMLLILVLGLAGIFSTGPLSSTSVDDEEGALTVGFERFVRHGGPSTLTVDVTGDQATNNEVEIWLSQDYLDAVKVEHISPQPKETRGAGDRMIYVFTIDDPSSTLHASFSLRPQSIWSLKGEAGVTGGPTVTFGQISYP